MTDDISPQPFTPPVRQANRYGAFREFKREITAREAEAAPDPAPASPAVKEDAALPGYRKVFNLTITGLIEEGGNMEPTGEPLIVDNRFIADLIFKPDYSGLRLTPHLTQLLLAHVEEAMLEMQDDDEAGSEEEKKPEDISCK